jgi:chloramphenicol 3-O phosphotransferase
MSHDLAPRAERGHPDVILINGPSGAGKTSIARALQGQLSPPHVVLGIDTFVFNLLPPQWHGSPDGMSFERQPDGRVPLRFGAGGLAMQRAYHRSVRALVDSGLRVIVDEVIVGERFLDDWLDVLDGCEVFFVGVRCDLEDLRRREAARPDRTHGHMQTHFDIVHAHGDYDVAVDTTASPTWRCVDAIIAAIESQTGDTAFERLRARRGFQRPPVTSRIAPVT